MSERAISVAGTRDNGQWTITLQVRDPGSWVEKVQAQRFTAKSSSLAYAVASVTLQALSVGIRIDE